MSYQHIIQLKKRIAILQQMENLELLHRALEKLNSLIGKMSDIKTGEEATSTWVDPEVSQQILEGPDEAWPWTLYANGGTKPVVFNSPAELKAATLPR